jgi:hypothetical protein
MPAARSPPVLSPDLTAAARIYVLDLISSVTLFFCAALLAGRVWRFPFDDEVSTLTYVERSHSIMELLSFADSGFHPPLLFLFLYPLHRMGLSEAGMRICSLGLTALSLLLFQLLALGLIAQRSSGHVRLSTRLIAVLLFGLSPLAIGQGDAIRWYPVFALLFALFITLYLAAGNEATRLASAVPLGLAASTNFVAVIVIAPFLLYRYLLERRFRPSFDVAYWLIFAFFAGLGLPKLLSIVKDQLAYVVSFEFGSGPLRAVATHILGFFGGDALGVSRAWVIIPVALITAFAIFSEIDRKRPADPVHLFLLMFGAMALMVLAGFAKPRSFLYLAPVLAAILTFFLDRQSSDRGGGRTMLMAALILAAAVAAIANVDHSTRPFKRNAVVPYGQILDFIRTNEKESVLIVSTDPVVVWELRHQAAQRQHCVSYFIQNGACFAIDRRYDSIFVISGQSHLSRNAGFISRFEAKVTEVTAGRRKMAEMHAGLDQDAALKSRLTNIPLDEFILSVQLYE